MQDLWRLSAKELAALIRSKKVSAMDAATAALARLDAVNPKINAVVDYHPEDVLAHARGIDAAIARGEDAGPLARRAGHREGQYRSARFCHHQRPQAAARCHREDQQPGDRQSAQGGRGDPRPHQLPGVLLSLVHHQPDPWRHQKPARSRHHAGRLVRRRRGRGRGGHRPHRSWYRHRRLDPLPAYACGVHGLRPTLGRVAAFNASLPERTIGPQISAVSGPLARTIGDLRIALAAMSRAGRARSVVGAGAAGRAGEGEAGGAVSCARRS